MVFKFAIFIFKKLNFCVLFLRLQFEGGLGYCYQLHGQVSGVGSNIVWCILM